MDGRWRSISGGVARIRGQQRGGGGSHGRRGLRRPPPLPHDAVTGETEEGEKKTGKGGLTGGVHL
jgi:hypothetical protein